MEKLKKDLRELLDDNHLIDNGNAEEIFEFVAISNPITDYELRLMLLTLAHRLNDMNELTLKSLLIVIITFHRLNQRIVRSIVEDFIYDDPSNIDTFVNLLPSIVDSLDKSKLNKSTSKSLDLIHCFVNVIPDAVLTHTQLLFTNLNGIYGELKDKDDKLIALDVIYNIVVNYVGDNNVLQALENLITNTSSPTFSDVPLKSSSLLSDLETLSEVSTVFSNHSNFDIQIIGQRLELFVLDIDDVELPQSQYHFQHTEHKPPLPPRSNVYLHNDSAVAGSSKVNDERVNVVMDIFPDQDQSFVNRALSMPKYNDPAVLIEALLEGVVNVDEINNYDNIQSSHQHSPPPIVHESLELDFTKLRIGKAKNFGLGLDDNAREDLKSIVLRRVEEAKIEEEDDDDNEIEYNYKSVTIDNNEENNNSNNNNSSSSNPTFDYKLLEQAYLSNPSVFDRSGNTRRSKEREQLRQSTGMDDSQIEGWVSQLERNPKRLQKLKDDQIIGPNVNLDVPVRHGKPSHNTRGRGGYRGGNRGNNSNSTSSKGGSGHSGNNRERSYKEKHGNKQRRRGHDKKFANQVQ